MNDNERCEAATRSMELVAAQSSDAAFTSNGNDTVELRCTTKSIFVERSLLSAASPYFAAMLADDSTWAESSTKAVDLGLWSRRDLLTIIHCLRTGDLGLVLCDINSIFPAINYFSIMPLLDVCIEHKLGNLSNKNVVNEFYFAEYHSIGRLRQRCLEHLTGSVAHLLERPHISRKISKRLFQALLDHRKLDVVDEDAVLALIDRWCSIDDRHVHRAELLKSVRFAHLTKPAFERCRRDEQCREVAGFRALLDSPRWSDLDESVLSGRTYSQPHMHALWLCETAASSVDQSSPFRSLLDAAERSVEVFVTCSWDDRTRPLVTLPLSNSYASVLTCRSHLALVGNQLFFYKRSQREFLLENVLMAGVERVLVLPDGHSEQPSVSVAFVSDILPVAAPVVVAGDLYVAHVVYRPKAEVRASADSRPRMSDDELRHIELVRYRLGDVGAPPSRTEVALECFSGGDLARVLSMHEMNKLCVSGEWKMMLLLSKGVLVAAGRRPASGAIIQLPDKDWNVDDDRRSKFTAFSDMLIVGNLAYIVLEFRCFKFVPKNGRIISKRRLGFYGEEIVGSVIVCDLVEGKFLPAQRVDLTAAMLEKAAGPPFREFELYLRELQNELYLLGFTRHAVAANGPKATGRGFVYRLQSDTDQLQIIPVIDDFNINSLKVADDDQKPFHKWVGCPLSVDAHLCEHASALHHHASQEKDPLRLEKLRRFAL